MVEGFIGKSIEREKDKMNSLGDTTITEYIDIVLEALDKQKRLKHKKSGKLSASKLGWPLQHQMLDTLGIEGSPVDAYTLRKFLRGEQVEAWLASVVPGVVERQKFVEYRDVVGYVDIVVDTKDYSTNVGVIPFEVKSVTNANYAYIQKGRKAKDQHMLQAALYALAMGVKHFAIVYVAADDLRTLTFFYEAQPLKSRIDNIIDTYNAQKETGRVPVFEPLYSWQSNKLYNSWPEWMDLTQEEIDARVERIKMPVL